MDPHPTPVLSKQKAGKKSGGCLDERRASVERRPAGGEAADDGTRMVAAWRRGGVGETESRRGRTPA
nr:unnamed protein product [Digitaria exilis]